MILAELVLRHTRHRSPTRRLVVERFAYPEGSAPLAPAVLLAGVAVAHLPLVDDSLLPAYGELVDAIAAGRPLPRRALRHRVQTDSVGLDRSEHRLVISGESPVLQVDHHGPSLPQVVGALVAGDSLRGARRRTAGRLLRLARDLSWTTGADVARALLGGADPAVLTVRARRGVSRQEEEALEVLGFGVWERPTRGEVLAAFRRLARTHHPDHGGEVRGAGERMAELAAARQLLLSATG